MPATSVLAFIVPKLVIQAENAASDCLMFVLSTYPNAAASVIRYLSPAGIELAEDIEFTTQMVWEQGGGRPDILGTVGSSAFLVIEAKFDAPLTKSQPVDYVRCLPKNGGGMLLFLVPSARTGEIWRELTKRCNSARISVGDAVSHANGLTTAPLQGTNRLAISSWESLVSTLLNELSGLTDPKAHADVVQLSALVDRLLSGELAGFLPADESRDKRDRQLRAMVDAVVMKLVEAGHADLKGYRATPGPGYYKRYMRLSGRGNWCLEFNTEYWARFGESLIWLSNTLPWVSPADRVVLETGLPTTTRRIRKEILIPILTRHAHSEAEALDQMTAQASAVAQLLASAPPSVGEAFGS